MKRRAKKRGGALIVVATAEEIEKLAAQATAALDRYFEEESGDFGLNIDVTPALEAVRFCAIAAGALGDARLLGLVDRLFDYASDFDGYADDHPRAIGGAITSLVAAGAVDAKVRELAEHENEVIRQAVASGLDPKKPGALDLLHELANDASPSVRRAARAELGPDHNPPWWFGKFASDPMTRLSAEDAARLEEPLRRIAELADGAGYEVEQRRDQIVKEIAKLPDDLAVEVSERSIRGTTADSLLRAPGMIAVILGRGERGFEAFEREARRLVSSGEQSYSFQVATTKAIGALARDVGEAFSHWLMERIAKAPPRERSDPRSYATMAAHFVEAAWPKDAPIATVIDFIETLEPGAANEHDFVRSTLGTILRDGEERPDYALMIARVLDEWVSTPSSKTASLAHYGQHHLEVLEPTKRREIVDRAIASTEEKVVTWAVRASIEQSFDEAIDGKIVDLVERIDRDARLGPILRRTAPEYRLGALRKKLRAGELPYEEAAAVLTEIRDLWPDAPPRRIAGLKAEQIDRYERDRAVERKKRIASLKRYLGPKSLQGKATEEEWARFREVRDGAGRDYRKEWRRLLLLLPEAKDRDPADDAVIARAIERARSEGDGTAAYLIAPALTLAPKESDLDRCDELESFSESIYDETIRDARATIREKLGMPPEPDDDDETDGEGEDDEVAELEAWGEDEDD